MTTDIHGANFNATTSIEDLSWSMQVYRDEFLERMRLLFGHPDYLSVSSHGIVAETDPTAVTTDSTDPAVVSANSLNIDILPFIAVTQSGHRIVVTSQVTAKGLASAEENAINVVTAKYYTTTDEEYADNNEYGDPIYRRHSLPSDANTIVVYTLEGWNSLITDQQQDCVPLAVVTVGLDSSGDKVLSVIHTNATYTWLRPWFSPVDIAHRAMVGSGTVSTTNPHGQTINEASVGTFTFPMLVNHLGMVVAKERSFAGVPGSVCTVSVPSGQVETDDGSGTVTGTPNAKYIDLGWYPVVLGSVYKSDGDEYAFTRLAQTSIIYQPANSYVLPGATDVTVKASRVTTLEPPVGVTNSSFVASAIGSNDAVVADGQVSVSSNTVTLTETMADAGPIPLWYKFYFRNRTIVKNPQVVMCYTNLSEIGAGVTPSITQIGNGVALVCLDQAAGPSLDVQVKITGKDEDGNDANETLTFDDTNWSQGTIPGCATPLTQFQRGSSTFSEITTVSLVSNTNAGSNAAIQVWVVMDPSSTEEIAYSCLVAEGQWDSSKLCELHDRRQISYDFRRQLRDEIGLSVGIAASIFSPADSGEPADTRGVTYIEDFRKPQYHALNSPSTLTGSGIPSVDRIYGFDRTVDGLDGLYESRALTLPGGNAGTLSSVFVILIPATNDELSRTMLVKFLKCSSAGVWDTSWNVATSPAGTTRIEFFDCAVAADTNAIKLQIYKYSGNSKNSGVQGFILKEYTT